VSCRSVYRANPVNAVDFCKSNLYGNSGAHGGAGGRGPPIPMNLSDYRPGLQGRGEHGVLPPFRRCAESKADVRALRGVGLGELRNASAPCLASRIETRPGGGGLRTWR